MMSATCSAAQVRICDFGLDTFINRYNDFAKSQNNPYIMKNPIKVRSDSLYDFYGIVLNNQANGNAILFFVNKEGYISMISLSNNLQNNEENTIYAIKNILLTIGANDNEITNILNDLLPSLYSGKVVYKWISNIKRYVMIGFYIEDVNGGKIDTFKFLASDNMR